MNSPVHGPQFHLSRLSPTSISTGKSRASAEFSALATAAQHSGERHCIALERYRDRVYPTRVRSTVATNPQEEVLADSSVAAGQDTLLRTLCILVFAIILVAVLYTAWIGIGNYSRIGV
jgi:hypothetical protein